MKKKLGRYTSHFVLLTICLMFVTMACNNSSKSKINQKTFELCGKKFLVPESCVVRYGQLFSLSVNISSQEILAEDIERHTKETLEQLKNPQTIDCVILGEKVKAYKSEFKPGVQIDAIGVFNGHPTLLLFVFVKDVKTNNDIPEYLRQIISLAD